MIASDCKKSNVYDRYKDKTAIIKVGSQVGKERQNGCGSCQLNSIYAIVKVKLASALSPKRYSDHDSNCVSIAILVQVVVQDCRNLPQKAEIATRLFEEARLL